jgi:hypothetical protein
MAHQKQSYNLAILIVTIIFVIWSATFIYRVSFIGIDGIRYFNLFDDAMISMRYAWNLSQGLGLVWNVGVYVEGYTNLLMTLFMSLVMVIVGDKRLTVLIIHISGIVFMLGSAYTTLSIADQISQNERRAYRQWLRLLIFVSVLFYYPLTYWSLMGMETGLLTLLVLLATLAALKYTHCPTTDRLFLIPLYLGLAYLTRPDALIPAVLIFLYVFYESYQAKLKHSHLTLLLAAVGFYALFIIGQQIFSWSYYGELLPNTYYQKATGMPLFTRLRNGILYLIPFVQSTLVALLLMGIGLVLNKRQQRPKLLLVYIAVAYIYYQIWVGGGSFPPYWRLTGPAMPLILLLCIQGIIAVTEFFFQLDFFKQRLPATFSAKHGLIVFMLTFLVVATTNFHFWPEITLIARPYEAKSNEYHVNTAIALNNLTTSEATIGVSSAGTVSYFSERFSIDFLGKSDKYIARLPPDLTGSAKYHGMLSLPGHNKYDLNYSIKTLKPTYVQIAGWGNQIFDDWVKERYATVEYKGVRLYLRKDSESVLWDKITPAK